MNEKKTSLFSKFKNKFQEIGPSISQGVDNNRDFNNKSLLIVDDEQHILDSLALHLENKYMVYTSTNGFDAIGLIESKKDIGLVIIDIRMPEMDGLELARRIEKIRPVEKIIRSAQIGRYGEALLLNEIGPYIMVDKSPSGTELLYNKIEEVLHQIELANNLIEKKRIEPLDKRPIIGNKQFYVPSIIGDNVDFGEGRWIPIYPFFSHRESNDRPILGYCNITPYYALQCSYVWAKEAFAEWSAKPILKRIERTIAAGERIKEYIKIAENYESSRPTKNSSKTEEPLGKTEFERLNFIAESGGFPVNLLMEGIREVADYMVSSERIANQVFGSHAVKSDEKFPTIIPRGIVGGVTRVTMPHTAECLTQPAAWTGNILIRRGDLYCPGMTHFFQEVMAKEGIPTQQFFSITKENRYLATKFLHKLTNYFVFMGKFEKGIEIAYGDLLQYMVDSNQNDRVPTLLGELQAPTGVGLFVAHEGFDYVSESADLNKAAYDNSHSGNCYIFSCKKTYLTGVDPAIANQYIQLHVKATEKLLNGDMIKRPHKEYLEQIEKPYLEKLLIRDKMGNVIDKLGEIIFGENDNSKPKIILLDPKKKDMKEMIDFIGTECHSNVTSIMSIEHNEYLDMLEKAARETQTSLKKGDTPRFLESNAHFDFDDPKGWEFYSKMVRRGIAFGSMPNLRTTHVFGDPKRDLIGFHEGTTFAHLLTWSPNTFGATNDTLLKSRH